MYGPDLDATLVIDPDGYVRGYDEFGCAYFGSIRSPNPSVNVHELALDISGCGYGDDYAIALATLDRSAAELGVTLWFDRDNASRPG